MSSIHLYRFLYRSLLFVFVPIAAAVQLSAQVSPASPEKSDDGVLFKVGGDWLKLEVCADNIIRVAYAKEPAFFARKTLAAGVRHDVRTEWSLKTENGEAVLATDKLQAHVDLAAGAVSFFDTAGHPILAEEKAGRVMEPAIVQGDITYHVRQQWEANPDEALFGLGQQQLGLMNLKGYALDLWQHNGTVDIPFLVSSRGYGILWDNTSYTRFGELSQPEPIPAAQLFDAKGNAGGLTGSYFSDENFGHLVTNRVDARIDIAIPGEIKQPNLLINRALPPDGNVSIRWEGEVQPDETGDYTLETFYNNGVKLWVDDKLIISHWRQFWLPWWNVARVHFEAGHRYHLKLEWSAEQGAETMQLFWKKPSRDPNTSLWSEVGDGIDYYFVYGPALDNVVAGYRLVTGQAPMMPEWAFGLWQCRQRYQTQQESLDVLAGYRQRGIPIDDIVQDWFYWKADQWGSHEFDPSRFPDPDGWIRDIHDKYHAHLMISVWPKFYPTTTNFQVMRAHHFLYEPNLGEDIIDWTGHPDTFYDAFNPAARELFWSQIDRTLFSKGVDAWWMDASEPDMTPTPTLAGQRAHMHPTAMGTGARMLNAYPLVNSEAIYEGQRRAAPNQRVFILTRSGFAGEQRYAAAVWSGDTSSTWTAMRAQITAGLGFCISGMPYWTMDIGGFSVPTRFSSRNAEPEDVEEWNELNARWFEFGTFVPLLRVHGEYPYREMWEFGGDTSPAYQAELKFDRLRYRLLPYIYSLAGAVTHEGGTIMRALVMDFPADTNVFNLDDEYLFGPALLVNPVTTYQARTRAVYLPATAGGWYDFWSGEWLNGAQTISAPAPYDAIPIYVRAGSIIPTGPDLQYTGEKPADPITLHIYAGADGRFTLYEDDGLTYDYEHGGFATIPLVWDDARHTLTIGEREGKFRGMLKERTFNAVLINRNHPTGFLSEPVVVRSIKFNGKSLQVKFD
ncbi:MAG TPA: TIM-barrel domain-containing protein [Candidatus Acidoferrales bacterium]|nr:TIM-barrel domain-containing protein [Candidatus Acidoferrales bacterium]